MSEIQAAASRFPFSIPSEHGPLHGQLTLPPDAGGLIILAHAGASPESQDETLAATLRDKGFATLTLDLLSRAEERFADVHANTALLARRLLAGLDLVKRQMRDETLPTLPLALCAAGDASPVVVRVAALRDNDIAAVACRGGLIDLAGMLYLHSLDSPLLVVLGETEQTWLASNRRALKEVSCRQALVVIPQGEGAFDAVASVLARWFAEHVRRPRPGKADTAG